MSPIAIKNDRELPVGFYLYPQADVNGEQYAPFARVKGRK